MMNNIQELLSKKEELHEDLKPYLENGALGVYLKHPLVFCLFYSVSQNALLNHSFHLKAEAASNALKEKEYHRYVFLHERPFRLSAFLDIMELMEEKEYCDLLRDVWVDSESPYVNKDIWKMLFNHYPNSKESMMDETELTYYNNHISDEVIVYRGVGDRKSKTGISHTLDIDIAKFFANRFGKNGKVYQAKVKKKDIICYIERRGESEIIITKRIKYDPVD